jgi:hypothetical protein
MAWTWERIQSEWLGEGRVAHLSEVIVDCFNETARVLGEGWIKAKQERGLSGSIPAASIVAVGQQLMVLHRVGNPDVLIAKLRSGDSYAWAELAALHAICTGDQALDIELEPDADVKGRLRKPDFRVRRSGDDWTYVEVSRPSTSQERERIAAIMDQIVGLLSAVEDRYTLEVYLRREPTSNEITTIIERGEYLAKQAGEQTEALPDDLGLLVTNDTKPGQISPKERDPGNPSPIIGMSRGVVANGVPERHVVVRLAYSDDRAEFFLKAEARQLPTENPGLIVLETTETRGSERDWIAVFARRLHPGQHTRVGGILLISGGIESSAGGSLWKQYSRGIINPHAAIPLPEWIRGKVTSA